MKKKEPKIIFDVHKDAELEALAKAYVQAANKRKMTMTQASKILAQIWREDITEPNDAQKMFKMPLKENKDQQKFRAKVNNFLNQYPEFIYRSPIRSYDENREYTLEIICAINKMFMEKDAIQSKNLLYYIRDYFKQLPKSLDSSTTTIDYFVRFIFHKMSHLVFSTTDYSGHGCLRNVDYSIAPKLYETNLENTSCLRKIDKLAEPYLKEKGYCSRRSKTYTAVVRLIWLVESFF